MLEAIFAILLIVVGLFTAHLWIPLALGIVGFFAFFFVIGMVQGLINVMSV